MDLFKNCTQCLNRKTYCESLSFDLSNIQVIVVTETPLRHKGPEVAGKLYPFIDKNIILWTSCVKCRTANPNKHKKFCLPLLYQEIEKYKPKLVITYGKKAAGHLLPKGAVRLDRLSDRVHQIQFKNFKTNYIHVHTLDECLVHPYLDQDNIRNLNKVADILNNGYPKNPPTNNYYYASNITELNALIQLFDKSLYAAFDIEAGGTDPITGVTVGLDAYSPYSFVLGASISTYPGYAFFVDFTMLEKEHILHFLHWLKSKKIICQNGKFDLSYMQVKYGIDLFDSFYFDTMLADHVLRAHDPHHDLKYMASKWIPDFEGYDDPIADFFMNQKIQARKRDYSRLPKRTLYTYGCMDADVTYRLFELYQKQLKETNQEAFLLNHVMEMQRAYAEMELNGWGLDHDYWLQLKQNKLNEKKELLERLHQHQNWRRLVFRTEADFRALGKVFYHEPTQSVFSDSQCLEPLATKSDRKTFVNKNGQRIKANTYIKDDLIPDVTKDSVKRTLLFEVMELKAVRFTEKSTEENQKPQVSADALRELLETAKPTDKEIIEIIIKLERAEKLLTTYIEPVFDHENKRGEFNPGWLKADGMIHCTYMLAGHDFGYGNIEGGTKSGRISARNPNMTNQPTRGGGHIIKGMFIPIAREYDGTLIKNSTEKWLFIQLDYSQVELRVLAALSGESVMCEAYLKGEDLHRNLACELFGKTTEWFIERLSNAEHPEHKLAFNLRLNAKTNWFTILYGSGPKNVQDTLREQGLYLTVEQIVSMIDKTKLKLSKVAALKRRCIVNAPYSTNTFGRYRIVHDINSHDPYIRQSSERILFNNLIQSDASDRASEGIYHASKWLRTQRTNHITRAYPVGAVHDSYILACPESEVDYVAANCKHIMENTPSSKNLGLPLIVDVEIGPNWGSLSPWRK